MAPIRGEYEEDVEVLAGSSLVRTYATGLTNGEQVRKTYVKQH